MNGAGNSFFVLEDPEGELRRRGPGALARQLCRPEEGEQTDGMIVIIPAAGDEDFGMLFYNADGSLGEMCGNGARCAARYGVEHGLVRDDQQIRFLATAGEIRGRRDALPFAHRRINRDHPRREFERLFHEREEALLEFLRGEVLSRADFRAARVVFGPMPETGFEKREPRVGIVSAGKFGVESEREVFKRLARPVGIPSRAVAAGISGERLFVVAPLFDEPRNGRCALHSAELFPGIRIAESNDCLVAAAGDIRKKSVELAPIVFDGAAGKLRDCGVARQEIGKFERNRI